MVKEIHKIIKNHPSPPSQNKSKRLLVLHSKERLLISFKIYHGNNAITADAKPYTINKISDHSNTFT